MGFEISYVFAPGLTPGAHSNVAATRLVYLMVYWCRRHFRSPEGEICVRPARRRWGRGLGKTSSPESGSFGRLSVCLLVFSSVAVATTVPEIAAKVDQRYNHLQTLRADFTEIYRGAGVSRSESGVLWLKRPGKMLWEYREPQPKVFVTDGKTAWFYVPGEQQARKAAVKKLDDLRSPLRYLLGKTKLEKELTGLSLAADVSPESPGDIVLRGVPNGMEDRVSSVLLEVTSDGEITRMVVSEVDGSSTEYRFANRHENRPVADQRFHFSPPPGVEVIEAQDIKP
jgi:outer membrane lipoprotein carrier protein